MRVPLTKLHSVFLCCVALVSLPGDAVANPPYAGRLYADYLGGRVVRVSGAGEIEWEFPGRKADQCELLPNGNVFFCDLDGLKEVSPDKKVVWEYRPKAPGLLHFFQRLPDGSVLVAESLRSRLLEIGRDGEVKKEIPLPAQPKAINSHQFRGVRKLEDGRYLVCMMEERKVVEVSPEGKVLRDLPMPGFPCEALPLPNGHLLVTMYGPGRVMEFDQAMQVVWEIGETEIPGNPLRIPYGVERLANGNTVVCNSLTHGFVGKQPQAFEVTRDKQLVWELADHVRFKNVAYIQTLLPARGESAR
ncbi:MAG: hypothetical protein RLZZ142_1063 [Verrucomicrobiota bacterium]